MTVASLDFQKQANSPAAPAASQERRRKGRARVAREMRIRPADFSAGSFEEVCHTLNFSRGGFYFLTPHDRYRVGMQLRIGPAEPSGTEGAWENPGEVVRVHRQGAGFGVAVLLSQDHAASRLEAAPPSANSSERRSTARLPFVASTEIIDVRTGECSRVRTDDLSTQGCYIDTLNPLPLGATVRLQMEKGTDTVEFKGKVVSSHPGSGMGLAFEGMTDQQLATLATWLRGEPTASAVDFDALSQHPHGSEGEGESFEDSRLLRLVHMLTSKGILSESEADSLLREV